MEYQTVVYYTFCPAGERPWKEYKKYQRKIAEQMLAYGFEDQFGLAFQPTQVKKGLHGKPLWAGQEGLYFNVSNTAGLVVCALSNQETGVDAEQIRAVRPAVAKRCCTESELAYIWGKSGEHREEETRERFFQLWTLKESFIKMTGQGMYFPLKNAEFSIRDAGSVQEISCSQTGHFVQKRLGEYWIALCTRNEAEAAWKELTLKDLWES